MKRCPQCSNTYSDEMMYCLADGTPLVQLIEAGEEETLVRPSPPAQQTAKLPRRGVSPVFLYLTIGLILLLFMIGGAFGLWLLWSASGPERAGDNSAEDTALNLNSRKTQIPFPSPARNGDDNTDLEEENSEGERRKLAENRRKLEEAKRKSANSTPAPPVKDPPVDRISFSRGRSGETVSGTIAKQRGFVLRAVSGQSLSARVRSSDGCVVFVNGSSNITYSTEGGDNYIYLRNDCGEPAEFSMSVSVR